MHRIHLRIVLCALLIVAVSASVAQARQVSPLRHKYTGLFVVHSKSHEDRDHDQDLRKGVRYKWHSKDGKRKHWAVRDATNHELAVQIRDMRSEHAQRSAEAQMRAVIAPYLGWLASTRACESGGNYATNTGNGFFGAYQFVVSTWASVGGSGLPSNASPLEQDYRAVLLLKRSGNGQWPVCGH